MWPHKLTRLVHAPRYHYMYTYVYMHVYIYTYAMYDYILQGFIVEQTRNPGEHD